MKINEIKQLIFSHKKDSARQKNKKARKKWIITALILVLALSGGSMATVMILHKNSSRSEFTLQDNLAGLNFTEDMIAGSGVTNVGITEETFDVENLTTVLEIEEVYAASGEEVTAGDKILKLTEDSVEEARKELERALEDAELAYRTGAIEYEQNLITAEYTRDSAILTGQQAKDVYDETVASLQSAVTRAEEELQDAEDDIAEYESYVNDGSYKSYFKVDEYQAIYDENLKALTDKMDEWGISWSQVTGGGGSVQIGGGAGANMQSGGTSNASILASLYSILEQNLKDLEEAEDKYEDALTNAAFELQTLQLKLSSLQQAVTEAKEDYEIQLAQAKLTYETSQSGAERAESDYNTTVEKAKSDLAALESTYEDAKENLELFESSVGDGYFYASEDGTILRTMVRAEQALTSDAVVFVYSNPKELTVTVSVDQSDITKLTVGDSAYVQSSAGSGYTGVITAIDPVSSSSSRTSVTYSVTVQINVEDEEDSLSANESVTVVFGMTEEEIEKLQQRQSMQGRPDDVSDGDAMPQGGPGGGEKLENGEMPEGAPGNGEVPENDGMPEGVPGSGEMPENGGMPKGGSDNGESTENANEQQGGQTQS
ncbi:MAG: HlyD family efflux transporter periplasmic adaptor subunit [Waltera sp.]|uniref:HlyD family efflux transporter periplasmic adaptor subunit n=1 Tax=Waltera sp. TaxID=2815806 RepID=UPI0039954E88